MQIGVGRYVVDVAVVVVGSPVMTSGLLIARIATELAGSYQNDATVQIG